MAAIPFGPYVCPTADNGSEIVGCGSANTEATFEGPAARRVLIVDCLSCGIWYEPAREAPPAARWICSGDGPATHEPCVFTTDSLDAASAHFEATGHAVDEACVCGHPLELHGHPGVGRTMCLDPDHPECECMEARPA